MNACLDSSYINPEIGKIKLKNLTTIDIQRLYNKKFKVGRVDGIGGLAPRSVERIHTVLNGALEKALGVHKIQFNPAKATELPGYEESSDENKIRVLSIKEQLKFEKQALKDRLGAGFMLSVYNGLRRGEILGLSWSDLDLFDNKTISINRSLIRTKDKETGKSILKLGPVKTKKSEFIMPLSDRMIALLLDYKAKQDIEKAEAGNMYQDQDLVFCTTLGTYIEPRNFNRTFYRIRDKAGIGKDFNLHALRHVFSTRLSEVGVHPRVMQEIMRHEQKETTKRYTHVLWDTMKDAINDLDKYMEDQKNNPSEGSEGND